MTTNTSRRQALTAAAAGLVAALAACSKTETPAAPGAAPLPTSSAGGSGAADTARQAYETASRGSGFVVGQAMAARSLLVFFDPQCPHCAQLWTACKPLRERVRMVWMPVAFLSPASAPQGAMLLAAADGTALMDQHESLLSSGRGGLTAMGAADAEIAKVKANTELWKSLNANSVPHVIYRAGASGPYGVEPGVLPTAQLEKLLGL
jgi:thiol:disulfide interchange protein DsbG